MIKLSHVNVFVEDQDRAKAFYTEKLGFEVRSDATLDGFRWLTVGPKDQPDLNILLARPQPPMFSEEDAQALLRLVAKGVMGAGDRRHPHRLRGPEGQGRYLPAGAGRAALRHRGSVSRRFRELVQPQPAQAAWQLSGPSRSELEIRVLDLITSHRLEEHGRA